MSGEQPATGGDLWALAAATESATALLAAVEGRAGHSPQRARDVSALAVAVGRSLGLDAGRLSNLEWSARLHDIGMLGVPAEILSKPGALDAAERAEMQQPLTPAAGRAQLERHAGRSSAPRWSRQR